MKKLICVLLMVLMIPIAYGEETIEISVSINDALLASENYHIIENDEIYVVAKDFIEAIGGQVKWIPTTQLIEVTLNDQVIIFQIGASVMSLNGAFQEIDTPVIIKNGRTMLPVKSIELYFDCVIEWDESNYHLNIVKEHFQLSDSFIKEPTYTEEDLYYLAKIVTVESGDQSEEMALAIANTVLNRVKDHRFPNSVKDVIYQVDRYVQFPPAHKTSFENLEPSEMATIAAKKALEGINNIGYSLYFNNAPFKSKADDLIEIIDGEYFYY